MIRAAAAHPTSVQDLLGYFRGGDGPGGEWRSEVIEGVVVARNDVFVVKCKPDFVSYGVEIRAVDDPSDSDRGSTDNPIDFIVEFLGTGTAGDEFFRRMSSDPGAMSDLLSHLAAGVDEGRLGPVQVRRALLRALASDFGWKLRMAAFVRMALGGDDVALDMAKLQAEMKEKGWRTSVDLEGDEPVMTVRIGDGESGDGYEAKIRVEARMWDCSFQVPAGKEWDKDIQTEDPIGEFEDLVKEIHGRNAEDDEAVESAKTVPAHAA